MEDQWQLLQEVATKEQNRIEAKAFVPTDSLWFSGHFPGQPILPGAALIHLVWQAIAREARTRGEKIRLNTVKKVRFSKPVRPEENLAVFITREEQGEETVYPFKVVSRENVICSGMIAAGTIKKGKSA